MKAFRLNGFGDVGHLRLHDEEGPAPQRGEVLVRVHATSLNYRDLAMVLQRYPIPHKPGLIPLSDAAGEIIGVGEEVDDWAVGDRVMSTFHARWYAGDMPAGVADYAYGSERDGWLAEQKVVSQEALVRVPDELSYEEAATLPCAAVTAWTALTRGAKSVRPGCSILAQGTGGVSIFAVQLATALGARVIATTSSQAKAARLRELGASDVILYTEEPSWGDKVRALTGGQGVDVVIEVGGAGTLGQSLRAVREGGDIAAIGFLADAEAPVDFRALFGSRAIFRTLSVGSRSDLEDLSSFIVATGLQPVIDSVFSFSDAHAAFTKLELGPHLGKIVIGLT